jgi:hypothetical protein
MNFSCASLPSVASWYARASPPRDGMSTWRSHASNDAAFEMSWISPSFSLSDS